MEDLNVRLALLTPRHEAALRWFVDRAGQEHSWPKPIPNQDGETFLASKAKGIYKPSWTPYALSVRQSLAGTYPDREPVTREDGTWSFSYFQENEDPSARDEEFTNRGLLKCWRDKVPVGVFRQSSAPPQRLYRILGAALVAGWDAGYFFLEGFAPSGKSRGRGSFSEMEQLSIKHEEAAREAGAFDPASVIDARDRTLAQIIRRRGQPEFRRALLRAYGGKCAISECDAIEALEASHVSPYLGPETNHVANGLLLRADLHTLFDLGLLAVDPNTMTVLVSASIALTEYGCLAGKPLRMPANPSWHPSVVALEAHRKWSGL